MCLSFLFVSIWGIGYLFWHSPLIFLELQFDAILFLENYWPLSPQIFIWLHCFSLYLLGFQLHLC